MHGGPRGTDKPLPEHGGATSLLRTMTRRSRPSATPTPSGKAHFDLPGGSYVLTFFFNGKPMSSQPFDLTKGGMALAVGLAWDTTAHLEAVFDLGDLGSDASTPRTLFARTLGKGGEADVYQSLPFHVVPDRGIVVTILVAPHVVFSFRMVSEVDDTQLAVRGLFDIENLTWAPYKEPDGVVIPAPQHFRGGTVAENEAQIVTVDPGVGSS